nr:hypothetical protein [Tanacetum cinerariifolium]
AVAQHDVFGGGRAVAVAVGHERLAGIVHEATVFKAHVGGVAAFGLDVDTRAGVGGPAVGREEGRGAFIGQVRGGVEGAIVDSVGIADFGGGTVGPYYAEVAAVAQRQQVGHGGGAGLAHQ